MEFGDGDEQALRGSGEFLFRFQTFPCRKTGRVDFRSREHFLGRFVLFLSGFAVSGTLRYLVDRAASERCG